MADNYRVPPYQYKDAFIVHHEDSGRWRRPNASEKELLMGFGFNHTELCMSASNIKKSAIAYEDLRQSLVGDGFSIYSFIIACAAMCRRFATFPAYHVLAGRMGLAPGFVATEGTVALLQRKLCYGSLGSPARPLTPQCLNRLLLTKVNHTGSDIRIISGTIVNPRAYPRQSVESGWWEWHPIFRTAWSNQEHINGLELRSTFLAVKHCVSHLRMVDARLFHLSDSYVCILIVAKGRTNSVRLQRILRQLNSYLIAFGIIFIQCHVESTQNPTNGASRAFSAGG